MAAFGVHEMCILHSISWTIHYDNMNRSPAAVHVAVSTSTLSRQVVYTLTHTDGCRKPGSSASHEHHICMHASQASFTFGLGPTRFSFSRGCLTIHIPHETHKQPTTMSHALAYPSGLMHQLSSEAQVAEKLADLGQEVFKVRESSGSRKLQGRSRRGLVCVYVCVHVSVRMDMSEVLVLKMQ
jgi:hypothetical protein